MGSQVQHETTEEGRMIYRPNRGDNNNKDNILNNNNSYISYSLSFDYSDIHVIV